MKVCKKCGRELDESQFYKCKLNKSGLYSYCKECVSKEMKRRYHERVGKIGEGNFSKVYSNPELAKFTPRQLMDELKSRGYTGELKYVQTIKL